MTLISSDVVAGTDATATEYNDLRHDVILGKNLSNAETDGATVTIDLSSYTKGKIRRLTLGGNRTLVFSNAVADQILILQLIQGSGGQTVTWPSGGSWPNNNTVPTLSTGSGKKDLFVIIFTSSSTWEGYPAGYNS